MKVKFFPVIVCLTSLLLWSDSWVEARNNNSSKLISMYNKGELSTSEEKLFAATANGLEARYSKRVERHNSIRAERIVRLCTDRHALEVITYRGIQIRNAYIDGKLDLRYAKIPFPVSFIDCNFPMEINLEYANVPALYLSGSSTNKILADGLKVDNSLFLNNGFTSKGTVRLNGAKIGGDLDCGNATFKGKVSLNGTKIGGDLDCGNATFNDPNEAFIADGIWVGQKIILNNHFESKGEVRFYGATIGIALDCSNGTFRDFNANGLKIERSIYMPDGINFNKTLVANGTVSLIDGTIGGILDCRGAKFSAKRFTSPGDPNGDAFIGTGLKIERSVHMENASFKGEVRFISAQIGGNLHCESSCFINPNGNAFNAKGIKIEGDADMKNLQVSGNVYLSGAVIKRSFIWTDIRLGTNVLVDLRSAKIGDLWDDEGSWSDPNDKNNPRLFLCGLTYDDLHEGAPTKAKQRINWLRRQDPNRFMPQPYEQLATVLHNHGFYEEAKNILIYKNNDWLKSERSMPWYKKIFHIFLRFIIGYGYRPYRIHWFGISIVIIGIILYLIGDKLHIMKQSKEFPTGEDYPKFNPIIYSVDVFTPVINLRQADYWLPKYSENYPRFSKLLRCCFWIQIISGWVFMTLLLTALSRIIKII